MSLPSPGPTPNYPLLFLWPVHVRARISCPSPFSVSTTPAPEYLDKDTKLQLLLQLRTFIQENKLKDSDSDIITYQESPPSPPPPGHEEMGAEDGLSDLMETFSLSKSAQNASRLTIRSDLTTDSSLLQLKSVEELPRNIPTSPRPVKEHSLVGVRLGMDHYSYKRVLNSGSAGKVKLGVDKWSGSPVAMKVVRRKSKKGSRSGSSANLTCEEKLENEVACLAACHAHPNIITLRDFMATSRKIVLITDVAPDGDLFDHVFRNGPLSEARAVHLFSDMMKAVHYMHQMGIAHRDIKPENLLLDGAQHLLLCDFGMAIPWTSEKGRISSVAGTVRCLPPEMVRRSDKSEYGYLPFPADIYSCGIVLFFMLTGAFPFESVNDAQTLRNTVNRAFTTSLPSHISLEAKRLMERMIAVEPERRLTAREVLEDPWTIKRRRRSMSN